MQFRAPPTSYALLAQELFACPVHHRAKANALLLNPATLDIALSTADAQGRQDASPRGGAPGFVHITLKEGGARFDSGPLSENGGGADQM